MVRCPSAILAEFQARDARRLGRCGPNDMPTGSFQLCILNQGGVDEPLASVGQFVFDPRAGAMVLPDQRPRHRENRDTPIESSAHEVRSVRSSWKSDDEPWTTVAKHKLVSQSLGIL